VSIAPGCDNACTFCIVPLVRGPQRSRAIGDILAEVQGLARSGVVEVTLLGQNVNTYGRDVTVPGSSNRPLFGDLLRQVGTVEGIRRVRFTSPHPHDFTPDVIEVTLLGQNVNTYGVEFGDRLAFGKLLRACGDIDGLERVRFTSPHPAAFTDDVITAMAETPNVMPSLHMPLQSGSDRVLKAMRRSYRSDRFLGIIDRVREQIPDAAITTDIIVGFPGETEADFEETLRVVRASRFASAFTFQYSIRAGTPAATMPDQLPKAVVQERYERLLAAQEEISWAENRTLEGRDVEVLVATGEGRKDTETHRLSGRARDNRLVHFAVPDGAERPRPGDLVTVGVTYGAPHHLVADAALEGGTYAVRRSAGGDAWAALQDAPVPGKPGVSLGMPGVGRPSTVPAPSCG
jgi:tRNA-2-methylthio-N6-dimethylallyladenosine synthase